MRIRSLGRLSVAGILLWVGTPACARSGGEPSQTEAARSASPVEAAVRAERQRFNAAITRRDTAAISTLLLSNYLIVNGRSVQRNGREAAMGMWAGAIRDATMRYVRTTRAVYVNEGWGLAEELGDWTGHVTASDGPARSSGVYAAKWQRSQGGDWRLQAEIFTTLACDGGPVGCARPEPIPP